MTISSRTPEGAPQHCPVCGQSVCIAPSVPPGDAPCPHCGSLLWFERTELINAVDPLDAAIELELTETTRDAAIGAIVDRMCEAGLLQRQHARELFDGLLKRESLGSTGIGRGVAVPHVRHPSVQRSLIAKCRVREGVDFDSVDGAPVNSIFLIVSPDEPRSEHLRVLERVSRHVRSLD